jgi:hypothetical protein
MLQKIFSRLNPMQNKQSSQVLQEEKKLMEQVWKDHTEPSPVFKNDKNVIESASSDEATTLDIGA